MKTHIICGCCGHQSIIHNFQYSTEEFAKRKIFVSNTRPAKIIPIHMKYITRQSILSNNQLYQNGIGHNHL